MVLLFNVTKITIKVTGVFGGKFDNSHVILQNLWMYFLFCMFGILFFSDVFIT